MLVPSGNLGTLGLMPDQPDHMLPVGGWSKGRNIRFPDGYLERINEPELVIGTADANPPRWFQLYEDETGPRVVYATDTDLFRLNLPLTAWDNVTNTSIGAYTAGEWQSFQWGTACVFNNGQDAPQILLSGATEFTTLANWGLLTSGQTVTTCKAIRPFKGFMIAVNLVIDGIVKPNALWASGPGVDDNDDSNFFQPSWDYEDPGTSSYFDYQGSEDGPLVDLLKLNNFMMVYTSASGIPMQLVGGANIWHFGEAIEYGLIGLGSVVAFKNFHFCVGPSTLYVHDGSVIQHLADARIQKNFYSELQDFDHITGAENLATKEVHFQYNAKNGRREYLIFSYKDDNFSIGDASVSSSCPTESGYDTFIRELNPNLWIQGYNDVVNAGTAGAITVTRTQAGFNAFSVIGNCGPDGAGKFIDGNGGDAIHEMTSDNPSDWTLKTSHSEPPTLSFPTPTSLRIDGPAAEPITPGTVQFWLENITLRQNHGYNWINNLTGAYDPMNGSYNISQTLLNIDVSGPFPASAPTYSASGTNEVIGTSTEVRPTLDLDYVTADPSATFMTTDFSITGHGGSVWTWPEQTWVSNSSYTFSFYMDYTGLRFGLTSARQDIYTPGWTTNGVLFWITGGVLTVDHFTHGTWPLGAMPSGYIDITYDIIAEELKLYVNGVQSGATVTGVTIGSGAIPAGLEGIGATGLAAGVQYPIIDPVYEIFHIDRALTPAEISDKYASRLLSIAGGTAEAGSSDCRCMAYGVSVDQSASETYDTINTTYDTETRRYNDFDSPSVQRNMFWMCNDGFYKAEAVSSTDPNKEYFVSRDKIDFSTLDPSITSNWWKELYTAYPHITGIADTQFTFGWSETLGATGISGIEEVPYDPSTGYKVDTRTAGRYLSMKIEVLGDGAWRLSSMDYDLVIDYGR